MKKYWSVFFLQVRSTLYPVLGVLLLMTAAEAGLFIWKLQGGLAAFEAAYAEALAAAGSDTAASLAVLESYDTMVPPYAETLITQSGCFWCFIGGLVLVSALLVLPGCEFSGRQGYTFRRLSVSEEEIFLIQAGYNIAVYILFFFWQALAGFGLVWLYTRLVPEQLVSNQTIFLAFYRNSFLHALLPLEEGFLWLRNLLIAAALGTAAAHFPYFQRKKRFPSGLILLLIYLVFFFKSTNHPIGNIGNILITGILSLCLMGMDIYSVFQKEEVYDC